MNWFGAVAALVPLNHLGRYLHWHWFLMSVANLTVIGIMVVTFIVALLLPFPGRRRRRGNQ